MDTHKDKLELHTEAAWAVYRSVDAAMKLPSNNVQVIAWAIYRVVQKLAMLETKQCGIRAQIIEVEKERAELEANFIADMEKALQ